jgi:hypothetical protein
MITVSAEGLVMRSFLVLLVWVGLAGAADKKNGVKSVEATIEPAEAMPGQSVTFKLTVKLEDGFYTYPLVQPDKAAANLVNIIGFPKPDVLVFVGDTDDPADAKKQADFNQGIEEMLYYTGTVVYERRAVVNPKAKPGEAKVALDKFLLSVCDKDNCFPAKKLAPEAKFKVLEGSQPVDKKWAEAVEKALSGK